MAQTGESSNACEPIAIIGMGCRWPGDCETPEAFWQFLEAQKHAYGDFPPNRINKDSFYHADSNRPGSFHTMGGAFIQADVRQFDHSFFGIQPREVQSLDPAQRKLLEVVYEAFESSGTPWHIVAGSRTGCFVGNFNQDHQLMQYRDAEYPEPYSATGGGITILSNRISYVFDLKGPSVTLDTACSSSMYALHLACASIQTGECDAAVVGGSNLILTPESQLFSSTLGAISPTSRSHSFDESADGYARADGVGALFIKRLSDAVRDRDPIRAVIRATAINANGRTSGITHPSPEGQEAVIRRAYERAGCLDPAETGYFEAHATGTRVGDPLEVTAIGNVFANLRSSEQPLLLGAVKSNMGHSEPTSGIAGVMKTAMILERGRVLPVFGLEKLNKNIDLRKGKLKIVTENIDWPQHLAVRRASVNSFGYGGANAHCILEAVDSVIPGYRIKVQAESSKTPSTLCVPKGVLPKDASNGDGDETLNGVTNGALNGALKKESNGVLNGVSSHAPNGVSSHAPNGISNGTRAGHCAAARTRFLLPFSSHDEKTLRKNVEALYSSEGVWDAEDVAYTLAAKRSIFNHVGYGIVSSPLHLPAEDASAVVLGKRQRQNVPKLAFVFTGQGAQWPRMGQALKREFPVYRDCLEKLDSYLQELEKPPGWTVTGLLEEPAETSRVSEGQMSQALVTAIQLGLVDLLRSWSVQPCAVVGHSSGEIAAAYAAGKLSRREAFLAAYLRGQAVTKNEIRGAMLAVGAPEEAVLSLLRGEDGVRIACHNSPESFTLSGDEAAVLKIKDHCDEQKIFARLLMTDGNAYHSHHMKLLGAAYEQSMSDEGLSPKRQSKEKNIDEEVSFFSSVYGRMLSRFETCDPSYWRENLESPVLFRQAVEALVDEAKCTHVIEVGPHAALQGPLRQIGQGLPTAFPKYLNCIQRKGNNVDNILSLAGELFIQGAPVDLVKVNSCGPESSRAGRTIVDLPKYQWQYAAEPLIYENRYTREWRLRSHPRHDILGSRVPGLAKDEPTWRNVLRSQDLPWLQDHGLGGEIIFPSTGYLAIAIEAATQCAEVAGHTLEDIESYEITDCALSKALIIPNDSRGIEILFTLRPKALNRSVSHKFRHDFALTSVAADGDGNDVFTKHCTGVIDVSFEPAKPCSKVSAPMDKAAKQISAESWYEAFARVGLHYGPIFQGMSSVAYHSRSNSAHAKINLNPTKAFSAAESRYLIHPAALDATLQLCIVGAHGGASSRLKTAFMPTSFPKIRFFPRTIEHGKESTSRVKSELKGLRGLECDLALQDDAGRTMIEVDKLLLIRADQGASTIARDGPFSRMVWRPIFDRLDSKSVEKLHGIVNLGRDSVISQLNRLALHQLSQFREEYADIFAKGSTVPHLQSLLDWTDETLKRALEDVSSDAKRISEYSMETRRQEIRRLGDELKLHSSEARLMCHIYDNLPDIYKGEKTGIQVALHNDLLSEFYEHGQIYDQGNQRLASIVGMLAHGKPDLRILEVGAGTGSATRQVLPSLDAASPWRRYKSYTFTDTTASFLARAEESFGDCGLAFATFDMEKSCSEQGFASDHDLVIASNVVHATSDIVKTLTNVRQLLRPGGKLILLEHCRQQISAGLVLGTFSDFWKGADDPNFARHDGPFLSKDMWRASLARAGFTGLDFDLDDYAGENYSTTVLCATADDSSLLSSQPQPAPDGRALTTIIGSERSPCVFVEKLQRALEEAGLEVEYLGLEAASSCDRRFESSVVTLEISESFFLDASAESFSQVQAIIAKSQKCLWLTAGDLLRGGDATRAIISGIAAGLRSEDGQTRFRTLDLDLTDDREADIVADWVVNDDPNGVDDARIMDGIVYASAMQPDAALNDQMELQTQAVAEEVALRVLGDKRLALSIDRVGVMSGLHFTDDLSAAQRLGHDEVEIKVVCAGLNNKDLAVINGRHHSNSLSDECAGFVSRVGDQVSSFKPGDRVYAQAFARFGNYVRCRSIFCQRLEEIETFEEAATLPVAFCTAIHSLLDLGRLQKGESVLIQSATGAVGIACLQIATYVGATIYATVGSEDKKEALLNMGFGVAPDHIFSSRSKQTADDVLAATDGVGVDVIVCTAPGQTMHDSWRCTAPCGRFVEIGRTEVLDHGQLSMAGFARNATFSSFDLEVLSQTHPRVIGGLMERLQDLKSKGLIKPTAHTVYHISELDRAFMTFAKATHVGKFVLSYSSENGERVKYRQPPFKSTFDGEAAYLLVGCLGGLGRSFSEWAVARGARHLIFLSRSGGGSERAKSFAALLRGRGVQVDIVKGNVESLADVRAAVQTTNKPIRGLVQAALDLNDAFFSQMTLSQFHATLKPRVLGALNLEEALKDSPLDFFQCWSSFTTLFGTASQTNYLGSNAFLDAFARRRVIEGRPATSLALGQILDVGLVSERPDYRQNMFRYGFYGNDEDTFLQFCEAGVVAEAASAAASTGQPGSGRVDMVQDLGQAGHLLCGVSPYGLAQHDAKFPISDMSWSGDRRFANLVQATRNVLTGEADGDGGARNAQDLAEANVTVEERIRLRIARLLYIPVEDVELERAVNEYGIDSMVAAELRNWFFAVFGRDVPLLTLLANTTTIASLGALLRTAGEE